MKIIYKIVMGIWSHCPILAIFASSERFWMHLKSFEPESSFLLVLMFIMLAVTSLIFLSSYFVYSIAVIRSDYTKDAKIVMIIAFLFLGAYTIPIVYWILLLQNRLEDFFSPWLVNKSALQNHRNPYLTTF